MIADLSGGVQSSFRSLLLIAMCAVFVFRVFLVIISVPGNHRSLPLFSATMDFFDTGHCSP
jgi:hypothetical protein